MADHIPRRGDHLYVWRKVRMYQHHGIVVSAQDILDHVPPELRPAKIEPLMVIEQNTKGLRIVTMREFRIEYPLKYLHDVGCARYKTDTIDYYFNRSGTCYLTDCLAEDLIVQNAIRIYNDERQREIWKTYSLIVKNCEQFAFICCTNVELVLGEQVLLGCNAVKCLFINGMYNAVKFTFQLIQNLAEQMLAGVSIEMVMKGNALGALTAFTLEALILSVRLFVYYYYEEDRPKNLARKCAITPEIYVQQMIQAGMGSLAAFGMSVAGICVGSALFMGAMPPMICSIFFGLVGYIAARWLTGIIVIKIKKKLAWSNDDDQRERSVVFKNPPGDDDDMVEFIG